ncbi:MAG TPA: hypothetical protein VGG30_01285, partial [Pirellulales bacterium]
PSGDGRVNLRKLMTCRDAVELWQDFIADGDPSCYFALGLAHDQLGEFKQAEADFNAYIWHFPLSAEAVTQRGAARLRQSRLKEAEQDCTVVIHMQGEPEGYINRANVRLALGKGEGALADCNTALELDAVSFYGFLNRGTSQRLLGHFDQALADYDLARRIDDGSFALNRNEALLRAACPAEQFRDGEKAMQLAKKACEATNYRDSWSLSSLAAAAAERGDWDAAVKWETEAIAHDKLTRNLPEHNRRLSAYRNRQAWRLTIGEPVLDD